MTVADVVGEVEAAGAAFRLDGEKVRVSYPDDERRKELAGQIALLREQRAEVVAYLKARSAIPPMPEGGDHSVTLPVSDPYAERMRAALRQINVPDYPAGMVPWLGTARPDLYAELTSHLPDQIDRLWSERAPLEQFESVLARLVTLHRRCCELCRAVKDKS